MELELDKVRLGIGGYRAVRTMSLGEAKTQGPRSTKGPEDPLCK